MISDIKCDDTNKNSPIIYFLQMEKRQYNDGTECYLSSFELIQQGIDQVAKIWDKKQVLVDFSAGDNAFVKKLKQRLPNIHTLSFDISPLDSSVLKKDWFKVENIPSNSIIAFNPPFGFHGAIARKFILHAAKFEPSYFVLILPHFRGNWLPKNYKSVFQKQLKNAEFYDCAQQTMRKIGVGTRLVVWKRVVGYNQKISKGIVVPTLRTFQEKFHDIDILKKMLLITGSGTNAGVQAFIWHKNNWEKHSILAKNPFTIDSPFNYQPNNIRVFSFKVPHKYNEKLKLFHSLAHCFEKYKKQVQISSINKEMIFKAYQEIGLLKKITS